MTSEFALVPSRRTVRRLDLVAMSAVAVFAALGLVVGTQLWGLAELHRGLLDAASALDSTGRAIGLVADAPLIGESAGRLAGDITATAGDVRVQAVAARDGVRAVAIGVGTTIGLLGLLPALALWLPLRLARRRELRGLRRMLSGPAAPALVEHLARAAVRRVPYGELCRISPRPWLDLEHGRHTALAHAELRRLGVTPPPGWDGPDPGPTHG
ncbi:hypothetical protein GCM10017691_11130 [Pseudonocardia petroleophila]|uniref:Uncharacterized protein n=1 Tax=Pseudonocardia petroleophila TaxID=37331 RepID=A0A7G7MIX4_9PSEU|nr:hypothetical protein [Pseudonocardia petroleophila]QNG52735.1 hypothetical protein H6H00_01285 [Pseudonocardia petroleophila]